MSSNYRFDRAEMVTIMEKNAAMCNVHQITTRRADEPTMHELAQRAIEFIRLRGRPYVCARDLSDTLGYPLLRASEIVMALIDDGILGPLEQQGHPVLLKLKRACVPFASRQEQAAYLDRAPAHQRVRRRSPSVVQAQLDAYHAAGHIVVAWCHGIRPVRVVMPSVGKMRKEADWKVEFEETSVSAILDAPISGRESAPDELQNDAIAMGEVLLAGYVAMVRHANGDRQKLLWHTDVRRDFCGAKRLARQFSSLGNASQWMARRRLRVELRLADPRVWQAVENVADLLAFGKMASPEELLAAIQRTRLTRASPDNAFTLDHVIVKRQRLELLLEEIAYHEAGHIVVGSAYGLRYTATDMLQQPDGALGRAWVGNDGYINDVSLGNAGEGPRIPDGLRLKAEAEVRMLLAGRLAATKALNGRMQRRVNAGARTDTTRALRIARALEHQEGAVPVLLARLEQETQQILDDPVVWQGVKSLATVLAPGVRLGYQEILFELYNEGVHPPRYRQPPGYLQAA